MQLVSDRVTMLDAMKNREIGPAEVAEKFGLGPDKVVDIQALSGDSTDNVPGVPGIGEGFARKLLEQYGTLDNLLEHAEEVSRPKMRQALIESREKVLVSRVLVRLEAPGPDPRPDEVAGLGWDRPEAVHHADGRDDRLHRCDDRIGRALPVRIDHRCELFGCIPFWGNADQELLDKIATALVSLGIEKPGSLKEGQQ